jgi:MFS family permease
MDKPEGKLTGSRRFRIMFFLGQMPIGIQLPYFVLFLKYSSGMRDSEISLLTALSGLAIILFQQVWGYIADVHISKKLLIGTNLLVSGFLFWSMGGMRNLISLLVVFFIFQVFSTPVIQLLHGLLFAHHGSEKWFGTLRAYASLGFVVANTAVGIIADKITNGSLNFIFPLYFASNCLAALWLVLLPERQVATERRPTFVEVQRYFLRRPPVLLFLITAAIYQVGHSLSYSFQSVLMVELSADMRVVSSSYSLAALLELPIFFMASRLIDRFTEERLLAFAALVQTVRWLLVWHARTAEQIVFISTLHCITFGLFYAAAISFINRHAPLQLKASAQTLFALVYFGVASIVGNVLGGQIVSGGILEQPIMRIVRYFVPQEFASPLRNLYLFSSMVAFLSFVCAVQLARIASAASKADSA